MTESLPHAPDLASLIAWVADDSVLFTDEGSPFRAAVTAGDPRLAVIVGENASGKSLFLKVLAAKVQIDGGLPIIVSIRERAGHHNPMKKAFMFGDEQEQSTGATSVGVVRAAFGNLDRPDGSFLGLDEPELGLSDGYAEALGELIGASTCAIPAACGGVVVVTHNRRLVRGLVDGYGSHPTFVHVGDGPGSVDQWLAATDRRSVDELLALPDIGLDRWRTTIRLLDR